MGGKAALIQVLGFGFIISMISSNLNTIATHAQGNMSQYAAATESHNLAVSGANIGLARFYQDTSWRGTVTQNLTGALKGTLSYTIANHSSGRPLLPEHLGVQSSGRRVARHGRDILQHRQQQQLHVVRLVDELRR